MKCVHCDRRIEGGETFSYGDRDFCCGCMSALCSFLLDRIDDDESVFANYTSTSVNVCVYCGKPFEQHTGLEWSQCELDALERMKRSRRSSPDPSDSAPGQDVAS